MGPRGCTCLPGIRTGLDRFSRGDEAQGASRSSLASTQDSASNISKSWTDGIQPRETRCMTYVVADGGGRGQGRIGSCTGSTALVAGHVDVVCASGPRVCAALLSGAVRKLCVKKKARA